MLLLDGPAVLGPARWRELDDAASGRHLVETIEALVAEGVLAPRPVAPPARLLSGAMNEAAVWLAGDGSGVHPELREATGRELTAYWRRCGGLRRDGEHLRQGREVTPVVCLPSSPEKLPASTVHRFRRRRLPGGRPA